MNFLIADVIQLVSYTKITFSHGMRQQKSILFNQFSEFGSRTNADSKDTLEFIMYNHIHQNKKCYSHCCNFLPSCNVDHNQVVYLLSLLINSFITCSSILKPNLYSVIWYSKSFRHFRQSLRCKVVTNLKSLLHCLLLLSSKGDPLMC